MIINTNIKVNEPTETGRIFKGDVLDEAIKKYNTKLDRYGVLEGGNYGKLDADKISHVVNELFIDQDGVLKADITLLSTPSGQIAKQMIENCDVMLTLSYIGEVDDNQHVSYIQSIESTFFVLNA